MVFYFQDLELSNKTSDWLIPILLILIISLPFLIYYKKYNYALYASIVLAGLQVIALYKNSIKYPL